MDEPEPSVTLPAAHPARSAVTALRPADGSLPALEDPVTKPPLLPGKRDLTKAQRQVVARQREFQVIQLRRAGVSWDLIGQQLKISGQAAWKAFRRAMERAQAKYAEDVEHLRQLELARLDDMTLRLTQQINAKDADPVVVQGAIDRLLRVMDRRAKYIFGLEKNEQQPVADEQAVASRAFSPILKDATLAELYEFRALIGRIQARQKPGQAGSGAPPEPAAGQEEASDGGGISPAPRESDT